MSEQAVPPPVPELTAAESTFLERAAAREARAQKSYLQKVHGRSKYVVHQGAQERQRRIKRALRGFGDTTPGEPGFA